MDQPTNIKKVFLYESPGFAFAKFYDHQNIVNTMYALNDLVLGEAIIETPTTDCRSVG